MAQHRRSPSWRSDTGRPLSIVRSHDTTRTANTFDGPTLDPAHPRDWISGTSNLSAKVFRQILGLNPFKSSYFTCYSSLEAWNDRAIAVAGALCAVAAGVPLPIISIVFGKLIDTFPPSEADLRVRIAELLGIAAAYFVVTSVYAIAFGVVSEKIALQLRLNLLDCVLHLDQSHLDTHDIDINSWLTEKIDVIHTGCSEKIGIFIQSLSYFVAAFVVGFILSPKLTGILLAAVIPTMICIIAFTSAKISKLSKKASTNIERANAIVESALEAIRVVQAFGMMGRLCKDHEDALNESKKSSIRRAIVSAFQMGSVFFVAYAINALAFYVGSQLAASGQNGGQAGTIFAVVLLILDSSFVVAQFAPFVEYFARAASAREDLQELFDVCSSQRTSRMSKGRPAPLSFAGQAVCFEDISFSYPARDTVKALNGFSLEIPPGSFTALVGISGGGKSTMISLLTGIYGYSGHIRIGPHEVRDLDLQSLRQQMAIVEQEPILFTGTILDNIANGLLHQATLNEDEILRRCETACKAAAVDFLDQLPHGIHTHLGNQFQLSGGQKQRICLARALIAQPAILIADEPTSALDARSEVLVMQALKDAAKSGTTVIMVAHRLSTVLDADNVAVVGEGRVMEQGTPQDLSAKDSIFRGLLKAQKTESISQSTDSLCDTLVSESSGANTPDQEKAAMVMSQEPGKSASTASEQRISLGTTLRQVWRIARPDVRIIFLGIFAAMISGALLIGEAIIFANLVQLLNEDVQSPDFRQRADLFCLMFLVIACVALASWVTSGTAFGVTSTRAVVRVKVALLETLLYLDMEWFSQEGHSTHHLISAFTKDTGDLSALSGPALGTIFTTITSVVGGIVLAHIVAWKIAIVLLSAVPIMLCAGFLRVRVLGAADNRRRTAYAHATSLAAEACRARRTVALLGYENTCLQKYQMALQQPYQKGRVFTAWSNVLLAISLSITYFVYALAYWWGSRQVRNGDYTEKQFFTVLPALLFSSQSAGQLFSLSPEIARAKAACRSILDLLSAKPSILTAVSSEESRCGAPNTDETRETQITTKQPIIELIDAGLRYPGVENRHALRNASLRIYNNQSVAFVGPSGAGKSTTVSLLERFYNASSGRVNFRGRNIEDIDIAELRDRIGLVSQEPDLLPGSILHNISLGAAKDQMIDIKDVQEVCRRCGLHDFISSLPDGYNTDCGSSGSSKLSGGQQQRVALARALIRNPEILLLDEPTSALDAHSEQLVQEALTDAAHGRTTVIVAHRLASIRHVDRIYVFDGGYVVEVGTHEELVQLDGLYASMARAQSLAA